MFISARASSTSYTVQKAAGDAPADVANDTGWCIFRAYTSLANAVDTDDGGTENTGIPGAVSDFDSWSGGRDLVSNNEQWNIACYGDAADTETVTIGGWITSEAKYLRIYTPFLSTEVGVSKRHSGVWDDTKYHLAPVDDSVTMFRIDNPYVTVDGLQLKNTTYDSAGRGVITPGAGAATITDNLISEANSIGSGPRYGIFLSYWADYESVIKNNIIYGFGSADSVCIHTDSGDNGMGYQTNYIYNNTLNDCYYGFENHYTYDAVIINNIVQNCGSDCYDTYTTDSSNNISSDDTAPGTNSQTNVTLNFDDAANNDYHLADNDRAAIDAGSSSLASVITYDIDGDYRFSGAGWDIGADESRGPVEYVATVDPDDAFGTDHTSLNAWEGVTDVNLTLASTQVFSYSTASGTLADNTSVIGQNSGATAVLMHMTASSTSAQALMKTVSGAFIPGEAVYEAGTDASSTYIVLANAGDEVIATAKCRSTGGSEDDHNVSINGWTTDADHYVKIWTDPDDPYGRHHGVWDDSKYRLGNSIMVGDILANEEDYTVIDGLQITGSGGDGSTIAINLSGNSSWASNNIVQSIYSGIRLDGDTGNRFVSGNIIYNTTVFGIVLYGWSNKYVYNNTIIDADEGIYHDSYEDATVNNNLVQSCNTDYESYNENWNGNSSNNISSDWTAPGNNSQTTTTVAFLNAANDDFHLSPSDTAARNAGTSSVFWDANAPVQYDIDGTARGWGIDIGVDEVPVEFESIICETTTSGGDCADRDYSHLDDWRFDLTYGSEGLDLTAMATRVFSGTITGELAGHDDVNLCNGSTDLGVDGTVAATTSDQILIKGITGTTTPIIAVSGYRWSYEACGSAANYWTISGTGDGLGASPIAVAKIDGSWSASDTQTFITYFDGDTDNYVKVYTAPAARHPGYWDYAKYRIAHTSTSCGSNVTTLNLYDDYIVIDGLQVYLDNAAECQYVNAVAVDYVYNPQSLITLSNNLIRNSKNGTAGDNGIGIFANGSFSSNVNIYNNVIYDFIFSASILDWESGETYIYNNTVYNCEIGIYGGNVLINNLVASSTTAWYGDFDIRSDYNATDNDETPSGGGIHNAANATFNFISAGDSIFRLAEDDSGARDQGFDITSSSTLNVIPGITTDIDGNTRPFNGVWDIGADEFMQSTIYRSVGPNKTTYLSRGNGSVGLTISGSTATFTSGRPNNVGVGDAIVYNSSNNIVFISGRTDSTHYTVQDADGTAPDTAASGDTGWYIYRAYTSLDDAESGIENTGIPSGLRNFDDWESGGTAASDDFGRDLVANNELWNIACYGDAEDADSVDFNGWTTSASNYLKVYTPDYSSEVGASQRHSGVWDSSKYVISETQEPTIDVNIDYIRIEGLQVKNDDPGGSTYGIRLSSGNGDAYISENIFNGYNNAGYGVFGAYEDGHTANVYSNIIFDWSNWGAFFYQETNLYNNTIINTGSGVYSNGGVEAVNNIVQQVDTGFVLNSGTWNSSGYNLSSDNTAPGSGSIQNTVLLFFDGQNNDYHLSPDDAAALDAGSASVSSVVATDIDGDPIHTYDIGADDGARYFESTVMESGGDFSGLAAWENANDGLGDIDLTATSTLVFNCASANGAVSAGTYMFGETSGASGTATVLSTVTNQILLYNIKASSTTGGYFQSGEKIYVQGASPASNYCITANAGNPAIAVAKIDGAWSDSDDAPVGIIGWTTGKYNYIKIYTTETARHQGKWDDNKYNLYAQPGGLYGLIEVSEDYVDIEGLQLGFGYFGSNKGEIYVKDTCHGVISINDNIFNAGYGYNIYGGDGISIYYLTDSDLTIIISNNIIYDFGGDDSSGIRAWGVSTKYIYNNTIYGCSTGIAGSNPAIAINNIVNGGGGYGGSFTGSSYNIADDDSAPGTNPKNSTSVSFVDSANGDFHLDPSDTAARDSGTSTAYSLLLTAYDIDGTARGGALDIGADEVPVEYISTICETPGSGGDCATDMDYSHLSDWEVALAPDGQNTSLASFTTRVFGGSITGTMDADDQVSLIYPNYGTTTVTGYVIATTSDQILIDGITGTTTPLVGVTGSQLWVTSGNYWTISGTGDDLGASPIAVAKIDGSWSASDTPTSMLYIENWITDNDNFIKIYTTDAARHNGVWDYTKYRLYCNDVGNGCIRIYADYIRLDGLQAKITRSGNNWGSLMQIYSDTKDSDLRISNNLMTADFSSLDHYGDAIGAGPSESHLEVWNNIAYDFFSSDGNSSFISLNGGGTAHIYNNTVYNCNYGIANYNQGVVASNNLIASTTDSFYDATGFSPYSANNATDDSDSASGLVNTYNNQTFGFIDADNGDFHLTLSDTGAKDKGIDLSSTSTLSFSDDIDGDIRPFNGTWDIGADEYALYTIYRSVGPGRTTPLQCGGGANSMDVSSGITNFQDTITNIVGVGDAIVYNASSSIMFISGRASSTQYSVQDAAGVTPDAVSDDTGWCIFRAYTSLARAENGITNTGIPGTVSFDSWSDGRDLVANKEQWNIACYADAVDTHAVDTSGWTTSAKNFLRFYTPVQPNEVGISQRHTGQPGTGYILRPTNHVGCQALITYGIDYLKIDGLEIDASNSDMSEGTGYSGAINTRCGYGMDGDLYISNNLIHGSIEHGIYLYYNETYNAYVYNNIVYDNNDVGIYCLAGSITQTVYVFNNTVLNNGDKGISQFNDPNSGSYIINNISINNNNNDFGNLSTYPTNHVLNNLSGDNTADDNGGVGNQINKTIYFFDKLNNDYHLSPEDTAALDAGTSSVSDIVTTDIDGAPIHTYDIGADDGSQYFVSSIKYQGVDAEFGTLSTWEDANDVDLTATTTLVFDIDATTGFIPFGASVYGTSSFAVASVTVVATTSNQILLYDIASSTFQDGEWVCLEGAPANCVRLADAGNPAIAVAKIDGAWAGADTNTFDINGWTTGKYNYIKLYTTDAARHQGKWDDDKYRLSITSSSGAIDVYSNYVRFEGLQIKYALSTAASRWAISLVGSGEYYIVDNIIQTESIGDGSVGGVYITNNDLAAIGNNIIYQAGIANASGISVNTISCNNLIYNNTIIGDLNAVYASPSLCTVLKNNISQNSTNGFNGTFGSESDYNVSDISGDTTNISPSYEEGNVVSVSFVDSVNKDFHLSSSDTAARDSGTTTIYDLRSTIYDIDGTARGGAFDIGADEVPVEYVSTICENTAAGGDCADMDYSDLADWEDAVEADIASSATRIFSGSGVGELSENDSVSLYWGGATDSGIAGTVVATTSDQIMVDWITGTTSPVIAHASDTWRKDASNYWTISGTGDALGASPIAVAKIDGSWTASDTQSVRF